MKASLRAWAIVLAAAGLAVAQPVIKNTDTTEEYLANYGIKVEEHFVYTNDGYILRNFRLPQLQRPKAPVVILQHGILASSWCWLVNKPELSLGIVVWRMGYDVWLPNSRGNTFSRNHTSLEPNLDVKFWNFSFDDMAEYDVVANIQYALGVTGHKDLTFIGWSQGTSQMFAAAQGDHRVYLNNHVNLFIALSPVTYLKHQSSLLLSVAKTFRLGVILEKVFPYDVFSWSELPTLGNLLCKVTYGLVCKFTVGFICGQSAHDGLRALTNLAAHFPAGTSVKSFNHYEQFLIWEHFGRYDYGKKGNLAHYGVEEAPLYDLKKLEMKTALFAGSEDTLAGPKDVMRLMQDLVGNPNVVYMKEYTGYSHVTWMVGKTDEWIIDLQNLLAKYNPIKSTVVV